MILQMPKRAMRFENPAFMVSFLSSHGLGKLETEEVNDRGQKCWRFERKLIVGRANLVKEFVITSDELARTTQPRRARS